MGQKKTKQATLRARLLEDAADRLKREGFRGRSLLEYVLGEEDSETFLPNSRAFSADELVFLSIVMDRAALPYGKVSPYLLYEYQHYKLKLYRVNNRNKLALLAVEGLLLGKILKKGVVHLLETDLETLGLKGDFSVDLPSGCVTGWVESQDGFVSAPSSPYYNSKLPYAFATSLNQIFHAAEFKRTRVQL